MINKNANLNLSNLKLNLNRLKSIIFITFFFHAYERPLSLIALFKIVRSRLHSALEAIICLSVFNYHGDALVYLEASGMWG